MLILHVVDCPYCGEHFEASIDMSVGNQEYIEDCEVCCRPIVFRIVLDEESERASVLTRRDDE